MFETALCKFLPVARRSTQRMAAGYILDPPWGAKKKLRANPLRGGNHMFRSAIRLCLTTAGCLFIAAAQDQPAYVRDACVKVAPGKSVEYAAMLRDVTAKQMRVRIDDGHAAWWLALSSVVPAGAAARCDYHVVIGYAGFPPEGSAEQTTAELKKARSEHDQRGICGQARYAFEPCESRYLAGAGGRRPSAREGAVCAPQLLSRQARPGSSMAEARDHRLEAVGGVIEGLAPGLAPEHAGDAGRH